MAITREITRILIHSILDQIVDNSAPNIPDPNVNIRALLGAMSMAGFDPEVILSKDIEVLIGSMTLEGFVPVIDSNIEVPTGAMTMAGFVPDFNIQPFEGRILIEITNAVPSYYRLTPDRIMTGDFELEADVYTTDAGSERIIFGGLAAAVNSINVSISSLGFAKAYAYNAALATPVFTGTTVITDGKFHNIRLSYVGTTATIYVDGLEEGSATWNLGGAEGVRYIGRRNDGVHSFTGIIANAKITNSNGLIEFDLDEGARDNETSGIPGPELISNNTFASGTANFGSPRDKSTLSVSGADLRVAVIGTETFGFIQQIDNLTVGNSYLLEMEIKRETLGTGSIHVRFSDLDNLGGGTVVEFTGLTDGFASESVVATATTMYLGAIVVGQSAPAYFHVAPGLSLKSIDGAISYKSITTAKRELYSISPNGKQYTNVSPEPRLLPLSIDFEPQNRRTFITLTSGASSYRLTPKVVLSGDFEIEVEISTTYIGQQCIFDGTSETNNSIYLGIKNNKLQSFAYVGATKSTEIIGTSDLQDGAHHVIRLAYVGAVMTIYVNDVQEGSATWSLSGNEEIYYVGIRQSLALEFRGIIANLSHTIANITALYEINEESANIEHPRGVTFVEGTNLLDNSDFSSGTASYYSPRTESSLSVVGGKLRVTSSNGLTFGFGQSIDNLTVGSRYEYDVTFSRATLVSGNVHIRAGDEALLNALNETIVTDTTEGDYTITFEATSTTMYFGIIVTSQAAGAYFEVHSGLSVRFVQPHLEYTSITAGMRDEFERDENGDWSEVT